MNFKIFKNKNFSLLTFGSITSILGTALLDIALALYVLEITGSAGKFSSILALAMVPAIALGAFAGTIADRINRKKMIIFFDLIRGVFAVLLYFYSLMNSLNIYLIYVVVIFYSTCQTFFRPAFIKIIPAILKKDELVDANAIRSTLRKIVNSASPLLGALLYSVFGLSIVLLIDGLTYLISGISEIFIEIPLIKNNNEKTSFISEIIDGVKVVFGNIRNASLLSNGVLSHLFLLPFIAIGFPFMIIQVFNGKAIDYGVVESVATIASISSILFIGLANKKFNIAQNIGFGLLGMTLAITLILPMSTTMMIDYLYGNSFLIVSLFSIAIFIFITSFTFKTVYFVSFFQTNIQDEYLGRYASLQSLLFSLSSFFGYKMFGYLFDNFDLIVPITVLVGGMILKLIVHIPFLKETRRLKLES